MWRLFEVLLGGRSSFTWFDERARALGRLTRLWRDSSIHAVLDVIDEYLELSASILIY